MLYNYIAFILNPHEFNQKRIAEIPRGDLNFNLFKLLITTLPVCLEKFAKNKTEGTNKFYIL